ncbi:uncharacterized protein TNCV_1553701 [Trichonephila clavipes]|nr:uncharacterized protein TNCV_1553701 [Trichonephila clavipes]
MKRQRAEGMNYLLPSILQITYLASCFVYEKDPFARFFMLLKMGLGHLRYNWGREKLDWDTFIFLKIPECVLGSQVVVVTNSWSSPGASEDPQQTMDQDESEIGKKIRRRLPPVPLDQEPVVVRRTKDRTRTLSMGAMPLSTSSERNWESRRMPQRSVTIACLSVLNRLQKKSLGRLPLRRFRRQYEQLPQFERGRIIGMLEAGWSARRVARQLGCSGCVVTSHREDLHIVRNARVQPNFSSSTIQAQVAPSLGSLCLLGPYEGASCPIPRIFSNQAFWDHLGWRVGHPTSLNEREARTTSLDDGMSLTTTTSSDLDFLGLTTSTDTYLQFLSSTLFGPTTTTTTTSVLASIPSSIGMSTTSLLGRRDLSAPHSLSSYLRGSSYLLDSQGPEGPKLPSYIMSLKQQLRDELRSVTDQRRRITDPDLSGLLSHSSWADNYDPLRKLGSSTLPPVGGSRLTGGGGASLRRARHRRHASDTKLATSFPAMGRDLYDDPLYRYKLYHPSSSMPFKSFEFESIDDQLRTDGMYGQYARSTYPRRSSLSDTPLTSKAVDSPAMRRYNRDMAR